MKESDWYQPLIDLAHQFGWRVHHQRPCRERGGWASAISGDPGFPDFVFTHRTQLLIREIKTPRGEHSPDQTLWLRTLGLAGADVGTWVMPDDWPIAVNVLSFGRAEIQTYAPPRI